MSTRAVAKTLAVSQRTIQNVQCLPDVQMSIQELRGKWKGLAQDRVTTLADNAWNMASTFVEQRDAKGFDYTLRGIHAMEKVSQSISGEAQKVEVTGLPPQPPRLELKLLVAQIFGDVPAK